jgi:hypothetical protein
MLASSSCTHRKTRPTGPVIPHDVAGAVPPSRGPDPASTDRRRSAPWRAPNPSSTLADGAGHRGARWRAARLARSRRMSAARERYRRAGTARQRMCPCRRPAPLGGKHHRPRQFPVIAELAADLLAPTTPTAAGHSRSSAPAGAADSSRDLKASPRRTSRSGATPLASPAMDLPSITADIA